MKTIRSVKVLVALAVVGAVPAAPAAAATESELSTPCAVSVGAISQEGDAVRQVVFKTSTQPRKVLTKGVYAPDVTRFAGAATANYEGMPGLRLWQYVVLNSSMYHSSYDEDPDNVDPQLRKVGGGWADFKAYQTTRYQTQSGVRTNQYGLRNDGTLVRWNMRGLQWTNMKTAPGFRAVKAWALISQTATYETFLANTYGGALYTIRIPLTSPLKPVVRKIRPSTWQGFESLQIAKCGQQSTMLVAIDKDTKSAHVYSVGHANGLSTLIKYDGKSSGAFVDPVYFQWLYYPAGAPPFGE